MVHDVTATVPSLCGCWASLSPVMRQNGNHCRRRMGLKVDGHGGFIGKFDVRRDGRAVGYMVVVFHGMRV